MGIVDLAGAAPASRPGRARYGICETGLDGRFIYADLGFSQIMGMPIEDILGRAYHEFTLPDDFVAARAAFTKLLSDCVPYVATQRCLRPDGTVVAVSATISCLRDGAGSPHSVAAVVQAQNLPALTQPLMARDAGRDPAVIALRLQRRAADMGREAGEHGFSVLARLLRAAAKEASDLERRLRR